MIPLRDDNPTRTTPVVTFALILLNVLAYLYQASLDASHPLPGLRVDFSSLQYALIPAVLTGGIDRAALAAHIGLPPGTIQSLQPEWLSIFTSMFMHGSILHIASNMWFLWIFGNNVEDELGKLKFLLFYLLCGVGAALAQVVLGAGSIIPMVGASGAIAGVLGAYLVLFPGSRVLTLVPLGFFLTTMDLSAGVVLGFWFVLNLLNAFVGIGGSSAGGGVAYAAHVGGFVLGWVLVRFFGRGAQPPVQRYYRGTDAGPWR